MLHPSQTFAFLQLHTSIDSHDTSRHVMTTDRTYGEPYQQNIRFAGRKLGWFLVAGSIQHDRPVLREVINHSCRRGYWHA
jgi:hypothetical protein